jgi:hypothetical protein
MFYVKQFLKALLLLTVFQASAGEINTDALRLKPGTLPTAAANGTLRVDSSDDKLKKYSTTSSSWAQISGSGGGSGRNYIDANPDAESGTTGWVTYDDGSAAAPVDGTGGSPITTTFTRSTSSPLRGVGSFLLTTTAADLRGEGVGYAFTIDAADKAKVLSISFDYSTDVTTVTGDFGVYIYDLTNAQIIQPAGYQIQGSVSGTQYKHIASFQTASNSTSYRLIIHRAVVTAQAVNLKLDTVVVGPEARLYGAPVTDWLSYTPTYTNLTVGNGVSSAKWRRVGDSMEIEGSFTMGTTSSMGTTPTMSLPSGYSIDTSKLGFNSTENTLGVGNAVKSGANNYPLYISISNSTSVFARPLYDRAAGVGFIDTGTVISSVQPFIWATNDVMVWSIKVPITGWSSSVQMSNDTDTRVVAARYSNTVSIPDNSQTQLTTLSTAYDTHGAVVTGTGFVAPVPGYYDFDIFTEWQATVNWNATGKYASVRYQVNSGGVSKLVEIPVNNNSAAFSLTLNGKSAVYLNAGDVLKFYLYQNSGGSMAHATNITVSRISGPSAIAASETVAMRSGTSNAQAIASGGGSVITTWTNQYDSHGAFNATTGVYTVPVSGKYRIACHLLPNSTSFTSGSSRYAYLQVSGTKSFVVGMQTVWATLTTFLTLGGSGTNTYNAGDTISVTVQNQTGSTLTLNASVFENWISIERVGN